MIVCSALGCVTMPDGERKVSREKCAQAALALQQGKLACGLIEGDTPEDEQNRQRCVIGAELAYGATALGCTFADEE